ncbi:MAG: AbrB/MazE/SpoVT family DNA-binding domain-containing protein [Chloroflexi bacterium]|nr:AbrB/MazE/SpoVT family DNA-binding domain-containing protein [Chloroflexota bacterium]
MSELVQVRKKAQITLPKSIRKKLGIEEGDFLNFEDRDGEIVLKAKKLIDKDQAWFWTKRWQEGERQADEDIRAGRVHSFPTFEEGIAFLHEQARKYDEKKAVKKKKAAN